MWPQVCTTAQIVTGIEVNSEAYFPKLQCQRHAGNIPATDENKTHY